MGPLRPPLHRWSGDGEAARNWPSFSESLRGAERDVSRWEEVARWMAQVGEVVKWGRLLEAVWGVVDFPYTESW